MLEQLTHVFRRCSARTNRSSASEDRAQDPPFAGLSSSKSSHSRPQLIAAPANTHIQASRMAHKPWLRSPTSITAAKHARAHSTGFHMDFAHRALDVLLPTSREETKQLDVDLG